MGKSTRWVVLVSAVLGTGLGAGVWRSSARHAPRSAGRIEAPTAAASSHPVVDERDNDVQLPLTLQWQTNTRYNYLLDYATRVNSNGDQPVFDIGLRGKLRVTRGESSEQGLLVRFELLDLQLASAQERAQDPQVSKFLAALQQPIYGVFQGHGELSALIAAPDSDPAVFGMLGFLVAEFQIQTPASHETRWDNREADMLGLYDATYHRLAQRQLLRDKRDYAKLHQAESGKIDQLDDRALFAFAESGVLSHLEVRAVLGTATQISHLTSTTGISVAYASKEAGPSFAVPAGWKTFPVRQRSANVSNRAAQPTEPARAYLARLHTEPGDQRGYPEVRDALAARITAYPAETAEVVAAIHDSTDKYAVARLMGTLAHAATPESVRALADLARDSSLDANTRGSAVDNMTLMDRATPESVAQLQQLRSDKTLDPDIRDSATLGLGAALRSADDSSLTTEQRSEAKAAIERDLASAQTVNEKKVAISALGNAGASNGLQLLQPSLAAPSEGERASAVFALRFVPGIDAELKIAAVLGSDPSAYVRQNAANALGVRDPVGKDAVTALAAALQKEAVVSVQQALAIAASEHLLAYPELSVPLEALGQRTTDQSLREQIPAMLRRADEENAYAAQGGGALPVGTAH